MNNPYRFGGFELNPVTRQLLAEGLPVALGARALDVLLALIERRERLVSKEELLELVWPGLVVEENNLQVQISALRKILGPQSIATIPGRGYRFTAVLGADEALPATASAVAASSHEPLSIAVLPFLNMGADPEKDYLADGITEDIITDLSRWRSLAVTSRNSTFRFKGEPVDMQRVGRELGVRFLVEGSVRRMGERIRITSQLINAETGNLVWGERFDRPMADLFAVRDEVVQTIVYAARQRARVGRPCIGSRGEARLRARDRDRPRIWTPSQPAGSVGRPGMGERPVGTTRNPRSRIRIGAARR